MKWVTNGEEGLCVYKLVTSETLERIKAGGILDVDMWKDALTETGDHAHIVLLINTTKRIGWILRGIREHNYKSVSWVNPKGKFVLIKNKRIANV